jgi:hypothetical protein
MFYYLVVPSNPLPLSQQIAADAHVNIRGTRYLIKSSVLTYMTLERHTRCTHDSLVLRDLIVSVAFK